jgi:hypothetical protein
MPALTCTDVPDPQNSCPPAGDEGSIPSVTIDRKSLAMMTPLEFTTATDGWMIHGVPDGEDGVMPPETAPSGWVLNRTRLAKLPPVMSNGRLVSNRTWEEPQLTVLAVSW